MGILSRIFVGGDTVKGALEGAGSLAKDLRSAITGDISPEKKAEIEAKALEIESKLLRAQAAINQAEAGNASLFVAGWRPFIGWTCGFALSFHYVLRPLILWVAEALGHTLQLPIIDLSQLYPLVLGMLGLVSVRTIEKVKKVQDRH